jgi:hypothetical protein
MFYAYRASLKRSENQKKQFGFGSFSTTHIKGDRLWGLDYTIER